MPFWKPCLLFFFLPLVLKGQPSSSTARAIDQLVQCEAGKLNDQIFSDIKRDLEALPLADRIREAKFILSAVQQTDCTNAIVFAYGVVGDALWVNRDSKAGMEHRLQAENIARTRQDSLSMAYILNQLGLFYGRNAMNPEAMKAAVEGAAIAERKHNDDVFMGCLRTILFIQYTTGSYADTRKTAARFLSTYNDVKDRDLQTRKRRDLIDTYNVIGLSWEAEGQVDSAFRNFDRGLRLASAFGDQIWIGIMTARRSGLMQKSGQRDAAMTGFKTALGLSKRYKEWGLAALCCERLCSLYVDRRDLGSAKSYFDSLAQYYEREFDRTRRSFFPHTYWECLANLEHAKGNYQKAYEAEIRYAQAMKDEIKNMQAAEVAKAQGAYDLSISRQKVEILNYQSEVQASEINFQRILFIASLLLTFLVIFWALHSIRNFQRQKKATILLKQQRDELESQQVLLSNQNQEISSKNEKLTQQQVEIAAQRDVLASKNDQLSHAQEIIKLQNEQIQTENTRLEEEVNIRTQDLLKSNAELINKNNQLEQYAFIAAHNLRGPVARILGLGQVFEYSKNDPEESSLILHKVVSTTQELDTIVKDLAIAVEYSKQTTEKWADVDLKQALGKVLASLKPELEKNEIQVVLDCPDMFFVYGIVSYVENIVYNLLTNAIKFRNPSAKTVIAIRGTIQEEYMRCSIQDNGLGIDMQQHRKEIFKLYKKFHSHVSGRGMGLFLVKTQMDAMNGKIEVESNPGEGSVFHILFPRR